MSGPALLVSVRDPAEVSVAVAGGATIIDVKDPGRGSLGRAADETLAACAAAVPRRLPWTCAAGELRDTPEAAASGLGQHLATLELPPAAVKFGLAGCCGTDWSGSLAQIVRHLPAGSAGVPVAYADTERAAAPPVDEVIDRAASAGFRLVLVDTFDKQVSGSLLDLASVAELKAWVARARAAGLGLLLAGRLGLGQIPLVAGCQPDAVAVRSAVCVGGRLGRVDQMRVSLAADHYRRAGGPEPIDAGHRLLQPTFQKGVVE
jgi:uncharacterized protein (UPF0264 family)